MEKRQQSDKPRFDAHMRTEYSRWSGAFGIELGKPVKLPNLKRTILNTSRQQLQERQKNFLSLEKDKQNQKNQQQVLPRFTSQEGGLVEQQRGDFFPKINKKLMKQTSNQRLERIRSQQKIVSENFQMVGTYRIGGIIGKGSYASVRLAKGWKGGAFAMKIYDRAKLHDSTQKKNIQNQIEIMERISHPNIIKYYETIHTAESINIVMELVENNSLVEFLRAQPNRKASQADTRIILRDLLGALAYLQGKNIVHRDIKLENILISKEMNIKLIDFGFSTFGNQLHYDFCGTPHYISPEIISKGGYLGHGADIWAVGIVMYKLLTGTFPFKGLNQKILYRKICRGQFAQPASISQSANQLIHKMLRLDGGQRPTATQLLKQKWFTVQNQ